MQTQALDPTQIPAKNHLRVGLFFVGGNWMEDELWLVHFRREPLSLAKKGTLQPEKRTLLESIRYPSHGWKCYGGS
jgi:hypothetical protein